jgi:hypothetical protein
MTLDFFAKLNQFKGTSLIYLLEKDLFFSSVCGKAK